MVAVGVEHAQEAAGERTLGAVQEAHQHDQQGVDHRHAEHQDRHQDRHRGRRLDRGVEAHRGEQEAQGQRARVPHEDPRRLPVVAQEPEAGARHRRHQEDRAPVAERHGVDQQARGDDRHHPAGEAVQAVEQVDRVGHPDDPEHRHDLREHPEVDRSQAGHAQGVDPPAHGDQQRRGGDLDQELLPGRDADHVVDHPDQEHQARRQGEGDGGGARDLGRERHPLGQDRAAAGRRQPPDDRHPAQAGHRPGLELALAGVVEGLDRDRDPGDEGHQRVRHQAGDERREDSEQQRVQHSARASRGPGSADSLRGTAARCNRNGRERFNGARSRGPRGIEGGLQGIAHREREEGDQDEGRAAPDERPPGGRRARRPGPASEVACQKQGSGRDPQRDQPNRRIGQRHGGDAASFEDRGDEAAGGPGEEPGKPRIAVAAGVAWHKGLVDEPSAPGDERPERDVGDQEEAGEQGVVRRRAARELGLDQQTPGAANERAGRQVAQARPAGRPVAALPAQRPGSRGLAAGPGRPPPERPSTRSQKRPQRWSFEKRSSTAAAARAPRRSSSAAGRAAIARTRSTRPATSPWSTCQPAPDARRISPTWLSAGPTKRIGRATRIAP